MSYFETVGVTFAVSDTVTVPVLFIVWNVGWLGYYLVPVDLKSSNDFSC